MGDIADTDREDMYLDGHDTQGNTKTMTTEKVRKTKKADDDKAPPPKEEKVAEVDTSTLIGGLDSLDDKRHLKLLLIGRTGAGKSRFGSLFNRPLLGLCEAAQASATVRTWAKDAVVFKSRSGRAGIETMTDLGDFVKLARTADALGCDAVVLDGISEAGDIVRRYYTERQTGNRGKTVTATDTWGIISGSLSRLLASLRDCPAHVVVTALDAENRENSTHRPDVVGGTKDKIGRYFNAVGYAYRQDLERGVRRQIAFNLSDDYPCKSIDTHDGGTLDIEPPEPLFLLHRIFGTPCPDDVMERVKVWQAFDAPADGQKGEGDGDEKGEGGESKW